MNLKTYNEKEMVELLAEQSNAELLQVIEAQKKLMEKYKTAIQKMIWGLAPFFDGLLINSNDEYIHWPSRVGDVHWFRNEIHSLYRELFPFSPLTKPEEEEKSEDAGSTA